MAFSIFLTLVGAGYMCLVDWLMWRVIRRAFPTRFGQMRVWYWGIAGFYVLSFVMFRLVLTDWIPAGIKISIGLSAVVIYFTKFFVVLWGEIGEALRRLLGYLWVCQARPKRLDSSFSSDRRVFLAQTALAAGSMPLALIGWGMARGAHDYRVIHQRISLPHLPKAFHGLRLVQISDIHCGSFYNPAAVQRGIDLALAQRPDLICFTGDLVNYATAEVKPWLACFRQLKADLGVFSILGNHDYGDYRSWASAAAKAQNLREMHAAHKALGWQLLNDSGEILRQGADAIALLGVGNWSLQSRFPKYGKLPQAYQSVKNSQAAVKILLSHDPSHWEGEVWQYPDIDLMLAGHTHGMQMGVEWGRLRWSPVQYLYRHWAGLYCQGYQYLYVNRGFGFSEIFPARVGTMLPEITLIELLRT